MDFDYFEGIVEIAVTYSCTLQKGNETLRNVNLVNGAVSLYIKESATNKYVFLLQETVQKHPSPKYLEWGAVEKILGSKLSSNIVLVTDAWRAYKTYAKKRIRASFVFEMTETYDSFRLTKFST